ncbi:MAG: HAD-IIB family hydrolase [Methylobacteriaceae bacterium]|nr:HAD-IIB family hydrolase [Methylobacteriaceae bacterium]
MYFLALATDYDGTLARRGAVDAATVQALEKFKETGRRLILVTGRELPDLKAAFPQLKIFDRVVAENGALLYDPGTEEERPLAPGPPPEFVARLKQLGVSPLSVGRSIVATWKPQETKVLEVIRELGLELQIIFNKDAVMVLPAGMNKAVGLAAALAALELSAHNVVGVGDAENDHAFLHSCGAAAAVANALPMLKQAADITLHADHGAGVVELMDRICREDARIVPPQRNGILFGIAEGEQVLLEPYRGNVLIAGRSGIGKSTLATALTERMVERQFEFCVFDPEGDYDGLENAVSIGDAETPPSQDEVLKLLRHSATNTVVNTQGLRVGERPAFFAALLPQVAALRARTGRPHWMIIDEAHHVLPAPRDVAQVLPEDIPAVIFITVHPDAVSPDALKTVECVIALGDGAADAIAAFCRAIGTKAPTVGTAPQDDEVLVWMKGEGRSPRLVKPEHPAQVHKRHTRKYAEGELGEDRSFYFRGPDKALNLRAQNLTLFLQIADGVDDPTWLHHLHRGDYSTWFRKVIKDDELAQEVASVEADAALDARQSRARVADVVTRRYTAPAGVRGQS